MVGLLLLLNNVDNPTKMLDCLRISFNCDFCHGFSVTHKLFFEMLSVNVIFVSSIFLGKRNPTVTV